MNKIYIATSSFGVNDQSPIKLIESYSYKVIQNNKNRKLNKSEMEDELNDCVGVIAGTEMYSKKILNKLSNLQVISRLGIGIDNIDLESVKEKDIKVYTTQTTPAPGVAELVLGIMLDLGRKISYQNNALKSGIWNKEMGTLFYGKTLGIIGLGTIGKTLVKLVEGFNFNIMAFDLNKDEQFSKKYDVTYCDLDTLLSQSDVISVHINLTNETYQLLNSSKIIKMKSDCILINTSRGQIIDENALLKALQEKKILGAGLDVYNQEPYRGPLTELDNVILTPHIGSYAKELRIQMEIEAAKNLIRGLNEI